MSSLLFLGLELEPTARYLFIPLPGMTWVLAYCISRFPTSGGQYHFVAMLSPPKYSVFLSWYTGSRVQTSHCVSVLMCFFGRLGLDNWMERKQCCRSFLRSHDDSRTSSSQRFHLRRTKMAGNAAYVRSSRRRHLCKYPWFEIIAKY